jgi:hypothetical protein
MPNDVFLAEPFGPYDDIFSHVQIRSEKVRSVLRK